MTAYRVLSYWIICLLILLTASHPAVYAQPAISDDIRNVIDTGSASDAWWSVSVRDSAGTMLEALNPEKLIRPASNLKLLTTAAILDGLGPEFRYVTPVYGDGRLEGDTWHGDIIIVGSGDPAIGGIFYDDHRFHVFEAFYNSLDSLGIRRIEGDLIGNISYFDREVYPKGWSWEDLTYYYGVEISPLSFNSNAVDLEVYGDRAVGETPRIQWFPFNTDYVRIVNEQVITPPNTEFDEDYRRLLGTNTIVLRSRIPRNYMEEEPLSVMNAPLFFLDTFRGYLEDGGITVNGRLLIDERPAEYGPDQLLLADHRSPPLRDLLMQTNKESDNFYAEMMLKTLAAERHGTPGSTDEGIALVEAFAHGAGIDTSRVHMTDGAGMSPATLLTTRDISLLLHTMKDHPHYTVFRNSLPVAGVDGTIGHRFRGTPLAGNLTAKTGYVSGVRALSGYMTASSGREIIFSIATNHYTARTSHIDYLHEQILMRIYSNH